MWRRRTVFVRQVFAAFDTLITAAAFVVATLLRGYLATVHTRADPLARMLATWMESLGGIPPTIHRPDYLWMMVALIPLWAVSLHLTGASDFRAPRRVVAGRYLRAVLVGLGLIILLAFLFKLEFLARTFVVMFAALQYVFLLVGRTLVMAAARAWRRRRSDGHRLVVVGASADAVKFAQNIAKKAPMSVKVLGFVSVEGQEADLGAKPLLGDVSELSTLLDEHPVDEVVFAVPGKEPETFTAALQACDDRGVDVLLTLSPQLPNQARMEIANVSGFDLPMLGLRRTPTGELRLAAKRLMDIAGGLVGVLLAAPVMVAAAIAIKLDSRGPLIFKQTRAGRNGRKFTMYKFRSMVADAEEKKKALMHLNEMGGPVFKIKRDPRITRVGAFIRRTSIDELPQFFNILLGDMSMVGPRPPLPSEVADYAPWQRRRLTVKPGLTGLWQVSGRNQVEFDEWMQMDLEYIDNWSLWLDVKILLKTIPTVLFHKGAS